MEYLLTADRLGRNFCEKGRDLCSAGRFFVEPGSGFEPHNKISTSNTDSLSSSFIYNNKKEKLSEDKNGNTKVCRCGC